jgi:hypothetical protein
MNTHTPCAAITVSSPRITRGGVIASIPVIVPTPRPSMHTMLIFNIVY